MATHLDMCMYSICMMFCISVVKCTICENAKEIEIVSSCPIGITEFLVAAKRKQCEIVSDDCPERKNRPLMYHCVFHAGLSRFVEVCARIWISQGYCLEYDPTRNEVVPNFEKNCTSFHSKPCPQIFNSTDNFKYPGCYETLKRGVKALTTTATTPSNVHSNDTGDSIGSVSTTVIILCAVILAVQMVGIGIVLTICLRDRRKRTRTGLINPRLEETEMNQM